MHDLPIITLLAAGLAFALLFGWITQRLGLSTLVGYMLAGIAVGPYTPGFVGDREIASEFAEVGVILLMFGVGMHFHPRELLRVKRVAIPGAIAQSVVATVAGWGAARAFGWSDAAGLVFGMALAVASTVVLIRMLTEQGRLASHDGHVAVGWLIVEDLFTVLALVVLPALAAGKGGEESLPVELALALGKAAVFASLVWVVGTRVLSNVMERMARSRSEELFTVAVFVIALGVALIAAQVFHLSVALGAFFAGLVVAQSRFGPQAAAYVGPFRDVFAAMFFVSVGMLFNPSFVLAQPLKVLAALGIIIVVKPLVAIAIVRLLRDTPRTAATVGVGLAQIGEFSFILGALGSQLGLLPADAVDALIAAALVSIALNPLLFRALQWHETRRRGTELEREPEEAKPAAPEPVPARAVIVTGAGELARRVVARCVRGGIPVCAVGMDVDRQDEQRAAGAVTVYGDAGAAEVLRAAQVASARVLVITESELADKMRILVAAKQANPRIDVIATASAANERTWLAEFGVAHVCDAIDETTDAVVRAIRQSL
ncbi:MAG TPA: cation:proton antiporter [Casimicrobiaceae bacterium]